LKFEELLVKKGLYDSVDITIDDLDELERLLSNNYNIDCFCVHCNEKRVFNCVDRRVHEVHANIRLSDLGSGRGGRLPKKEEIFKSYLNKWYCLSFSCSREQEHSILINILVTENKIFKIGQYPSFADSSKGDVKKYKKVLDDMFKEYNTSLGLFSHGVGIGSFVYLRRIIENLVFKKYKQFKSELHISEDDFEHSKFDIKIEILKNYLPPLLVKNKNIYGIVSKGVHELREEECLEMYPYLKVGIELILDEIIEKKGRAEKEKLFSNFIADKAGELKQK
jgi:hypothetical protein